jgi:hypothetical protein
MGKKDFLNNLELLKQEIIKAGRRIVIRIFKSKISNVS